MSHLEPFPGDEPLEPAIDPGAVDPDEIGAAARRDVFDRDVPLKPDRDLTLPELIEESVFHRNWALLTRLGVDRASIETWDRYLVRNRRIFVPIDVQAFVVAADDAEPTVAVTGGPGDPAPFADGDVRPAGVHLHWALPDALLRGSADPEADDLEFPELPDRWTVVRLLYPRGRSRPLLQGWVVDSVEGSVTPLASYSGTPAANSEVPTFDRLDGAAGGSLHWTAVYEASVNRFAFHDPLDDEQLDDGAPSRATYVVAGWASTADRDPLGPTRTAKADLFELLERLDWSATEMPAGEYRSGLVELQRIKDLDLDDVEGTTSDVEFRFGGSGQHVEGVAIEGVTRAADVGAEKIVVTSDPPFYSSLLHGYVAGVPVDGSVTAGVDDRPRAENLDVALGLDLNDLVASWFADSWALPDERRRSVELLTSALTTDLLDQLTAPDGLRRIEEHDHAGSFWSFAGPPPPTSRPDRLLNTDVAPANPTVMGRKGRSARRRAEAAARNSTSSSSSSTGTSGGLGSSATLIWTDDPKSSLHTVREAQRQEQIKTAMVAAIEDQLAESRTVPKPGPRHHRPTAPMLAVRGCRPSLRYLGDGMYTDDGTLKVRYPSQLRDRLGDVLAGSDLVATLGSGAVPFDVLKVVQEAVLLDPYATGWRADVVARREGSSSSGSEFSKAVARRMEAETLLLFGPDGTYTGDATASLDAIARASARSAAGAGTGAGTTADATAAAGVGWQRDAQHWRERIRESAELARASLGAGQPLSPVGITTWRQPWAPLWAEWEVEVTGRTTIAGWRLDDLDLEPQPEVDGGDGEAEVVARRYVGRTPLGRGALKSLHESVGRWVTEQARRDASLGYRHRRDLSDIQRFLSPLDMASTSLDGIREQLLGIDYVGGLSSGPEEDDRPRADGRAQPLFGGRVALRRLRLVDAFGRTLDVPVDRIDTTTRLRVADDPAAITVRPRLQHGSRLLLRLVDPAHQGSGADAPEAFVDQVDPTGAVNPVVGFLLPDHIDEALEFFDVTGTPIGQLDHHDLTGAVRWEPAPGRPLPPGAGPLADLDPHAALAGRIASGVVQADVNSRSNVSDDPDAGTFDPEHDSSLSAFLRAVDTTMWTVDTLTATGSSTVAGLVGRPIAVVRAVLRLETPDDLDEVVVPTPDVAAERRAAFERLADQRFPGRLGDLQRSDDSLLGYFVDDDYSRFHLVDGRLVAQARDSGRHRGQLGLLGSVVSPPARALDHPYVSGDDVLMVRPGQTYRLTMLMLPAGKVHITSGILPRKAIELHNDWIESGLKRLVPSVRVGPVLVDGSEIRLPKINLLGEKQEFIRRTGPLTWREDPILAASQAALLPRLPHELQEGWVRVMEGTSE